jgi:hypothetical protein
MSVKLWWSGGELMSLDTGEDGAEEEAVLQEEFEDQEDYMDLFGQLRNAFSLLCAAAGELCPDMAAGVLYQETHRVLTGEYEGAVALCLQRQQGQQASQGLEGPLQRVVLQLEALVPLMETIVRAVVRTTRGDEGMIGRGGVEWCIS